MGIHRTWEKEAILGAQKTTATQRSAWVVELFFNISTAEDYGPAAYSSLFDEDFANVPLPS